MGKISDEIIVERNNTETLTCGIFYCRDSAEINGSGLHYTSKWVDSEVLQNRQQNIPLSVSFQLGRKKYRFDFLSIFTK